MNTKNRTRIQWMALLGLGGTLFYFLHVVLGKSNYPEYDSFAQAISDLTAMDAPSRDVASALATVNGFFTVAACTLFCIFYEDKINKMFRIGVYLFTVMQWISAVGYRLFSLSESGYAGTFQDKMHMVVTVFVVLFSVSSMVLIGIGTLKMEGHRKFGVFTLIMLGIMIIGSLGVGFFPTRYFGVAERLSVYSVVVYSAALSLFTFMYQE